MSIRPAILRSSFYTDREVESALKPLTLFRAMEALLFMTAGHRIYRTKAAVMHCVARIYYANLPSSKTRMTMLGHAT